MKKLYDHTDIQLTELFGLGDIDAFEEIYNTYCLKLYSAAYKRLRDRETAQEIVQDFFASFWINREHVKIQTRHWAGSALFHSLSILLTRMTVD